MMPNPAVADRVEIDARRADAERTPDGWRFAERADEIRYLDTTPLTGSPPSALAPPDRPVATAAHHHSSGGR
jgi:hypothetical protein